MIDRVTSRVGGLLLGVLLRTACSACSARGSPSSPESPTPAPNVPAPSETPPAARGGSAADCPVTLPRTFRPPRGVPADALFGAASSYGNGKLWVGGLGRRGVIVATPDFIEPDGSVGMKFGWWRQVSGPLRSTGRRLDAPAHPVRADVPTGPWPRMQAGQTR